eukprot:SAG31_NODE_4455_length_3217_cov_2.383579_1_plen_288_part_00
MRPAAESRNYCCGHPGQASSSRPRLRPTLRSVLGMGKKAKAKPKAKEKKAAKAAALAAEHAKRDAVRAALGAPDPLGALPPIFGTFKKHGIDASISHHAGAAALPAAEREALCSLAEPRQHRALAESDARLLVVRGMLEVRQLDSRLPVDSSFAYICFAAIRCARSALCRAARFEGLLRHRCAAKSRRVARQGRTSSGGRRDDSRLRALPVSDVLSHPGTLFWLCARHSKMSCAAAQLRGGRGLPAAVLVRHAAVLPRPAQRPRKVSASGTCAFHLVGELVFIGSRD